MDRLTVDSEIIFSITYNTINSTGNKINRFYVNITYYHAKVLLFD